MERSIAFYRVLFGVDPAKHHRDYAKFELAQPPLVFSLVPNPPSTGGALSHFGFPVETREEVEAIGKRLTEAGLPVSCQDGTVCGYARQDKIWIPDPDHNYWEVYVVYEHIDPESVRTGFDGINPLSKVRAATPPAAPLEPLVSLTPSLPAAVASNAPAIWEHRVMEAVPDRIPHADGSLDVVRLEGTFNGEATADARTRLLGEAFRALRPGGEVQVHGLVSDRPLTTMPSLPGVAALVQQVPTESEPLQELARAGFVSLRVTKLPASAVFHSAGAEMREVKLSAKRPVRASSPSPTDDSSYVVLYKGPFAEARDDFGNAFPRGRRIPVSRQAWEELGNSPAAGQFLFLGDPQRDDAACS
jgi:catechol 2,3-dioxygenase-like lactoylglutathione lyase family enzyme